MKNPPNRPILKAVSNGLLLAAAALVLAGLGLLLLLWQLVPSPPSQQEICGLVLKNREDLETIVAELQSLDAHWISVDAEEMRTYERFGLMPNGTYYPTGEQAALPTGEQLGRCLQEMKLANIDYRLYEDDAIELAAFFWDWGTGCYWATPDAPTEKAYISHHAMTPSGSGWAYEEGGTRYYTEKICEHWYFFEVAS